MKPKWNTFLIFLENSLRILFITVFIWFTMLRFVDMHIGEAVSLLLAGMIII